MNAAKQQGFQVLGAKQRSHGASLVPVWEALDEEKKMAQRPPVHEDKHPAAPHPAASTKSGLFPTTSTSKSKHQHSHGAVATRSASISEQGESTASTSSPSSVNAVSVATGGPLLFFSDGSTVPVPYEANAARMRTGTHTGRPAKLKELGISWFGGAAPRELGHATDSLSTSSITPARYNHGEPAWSRCMVSSLSFGFGVHH